MDELIIPILSQKERDFICGPWTVEVGKKVWSVVNKNIKIKKGIPIFGTVSPNCDLIIYLKINDELLKERVKSRGGNLVDVKKMQKFLEEEIKKLNIPIIEFNIE